MPEISRFYGIVIAMFYNDHSPPHFHARYGDQQAIIALDDLRIIEGSLSGRTLRLVQEWASLYPDELLEDWDLARMREPLNPIPPLE